MTRDDETTGIVGKSERDDEEVAPASLRRVMVFSFFVVPFCIAVLGVALFTGVCMLTREAPDLSSLLDDVQHGYNNKRWRAAYQLVTLLDVSSPVALAPGDTERFILAFEESAPQKDTAVRQYLALAMGCTRSQVFAPTLLGALESDPPEMTPFLIRALGRLGNAEAATAIAAHLSNPNPTVRLESVIALGALGATESKTALRIALEDPEPNIQWDAAIALAKLGDSGGQPLLLSLLDRDYLSGFPTVDGQETNRILRVAICAAALLNDPSLNRVIETLAANDRNMEVRRTASDALLQEKQAATHSRAANEQG